MKEILQYCKGEITWNELRKAIDPSSREIGWYVYTRNTSKRRCRSAGQVAHAVRKYAETLGAPMIGFPSATWCGDYRRTKESIKAELKGNAVCEMYVAYIRSIAERRI